MPNAFFVPSISRPSSVLWSHLTFLCRCHLLISPSKANTPPTDDFLLTLVIVSFSTRFLWLWSKKKDKCLFIMFNQIYYSLLMSLELVAKMTWQCRWHYYKVFGTNLNERRSDECCMSDWRKRPWEKHQWFKSSNKMSLFYSVVSYHGSAFFPMENKNPCKKRWVNVDARIKKINNRVNSPIMRELFRLSNQHVSPH